MGSPRKTIVENRWYDVWQKGTDLLRLLRDGVEYKRGKSRGEADCDFPAKLSDD